MDFVSGALRLPLEIEIAPASQSLLAGTLHTTDAGLAANRRCGEGHSDGSLDEVIESELCSDRNHGYDSAGDEESVHDRLLLHQRFTRVSSRAAAFPAEWRRRRSRYR